MEESTLKKAGHLIRSTRVMTIGVTADNIPWSSPVYFVFYKNGFYFFSNERSRHIQCAIAHNSVAASVFHDSDKIDEIFGFQMAGRIEPVLKQTDYLVIVKQYVSKFSFLKKAFGSQLWEKKRFFLEKFKSRLYVFFPDRIFLSNNSKSSEKRSEFDMEYLKKDLV